MIRSDGRLYGYFGNDNSGAIYRLTPYSRSIISLRPGDFYAPRKKDRLRDGSFVMRYPINLRLGCVILYAFLSGVRRWSYLIGDIFDFRITPCNFTPIVGQ